MKEIKLIDITLRNFKGIKEFSLKTNGGNPRVFGDNATGKTTLFDGFVWLLFDKDSQNKKNFDIKTLDNDGNVLHGLEHEVEATFSVNGKNTTLRKAYYEKWTKKRGSATSEFTGHTTDYSIDGVPSNKKEYDQYISNLIDENVFKLLTNPSYFNEQLKKDERRKVLMDLSGGITDDEVISSNEKLEELPAILQGKSIDDYRKIIASKRAGINKELATIQPRVDEVKRGIPDIDGSDKAALEKKIDDLNAEIDKKQDQIAGIRNGNAITQKQKEIQEIEMELMKIKQVHESGSKDDIYKCQARVQEEESNAHILKRDMDNAKQQINYNNENIQSIENQLVQLREEWKKVNGLEFEHNDQCECPSCGQSLPENQVAAAREKALSQFNLEKSKRLEEIDAKGKQGSERKQGFDKENEQLAAKVDKIQGQVAEKEALVEKLKTQLKQLENQVVDITENARYVAKLQEKQNVTNELNDIRLSADKSIQDVQTEIVSLKSDRDQAQAELGQFAVVDQSLSRIKELEERERDLAAEFEKLEQELYLTEEFIRSKVDLLEEKINSKFKYARFKLFEQQINGGLKEECETMFDGVPYSSGLNNAAKINVGLDIINTLSEHYGFSAPIFVDNAEAVTQLIDTDSQLISLVVSEKDKQLRVENPTSDSDETVLNMEVI